MSSRSNGVTNDSFSSRMIAWVASSPACSAARILSAIALRSAGSAPSSSLSRPAPTTRFCPEVANMP